MRKFMTKAEVLEAVGVAYPTLWTWMRDGKFPLSVEFGGGVRWYADEVEEWVENRPRRQLKKSDKAA